MLSLLTVCTLAGIFTFASVSAAAPASVQSGGKTYYMVNGLDTKMDSGNEVCSSIGKKCVGYTSLSSNTVCKMFHPKAKDLKSVNGSKSGFFCNGAPQKGLACEKTMNTCQVCPTCNVNADCSTAIGQQFREMYVECAAASSSSSSARPKTVLTRSSSSKKAGTYGPLPLPGQRSSTTAKSVPRSAKQNAGALCQHGGECKSGMCLGVIPGKVYRCSCIDPTTKWQSCTK